MMTPNLVNGIFAFLHHLAAFAVAACLFYEFMAFDRHLTVPEARRIQTVDLIYGIAAGVVLVVGLLRVFFFAKGAGFYAISPFFWVKMAAFVLVAILSIYPTIRYISWNKALKQNQPPEITEVEFSRIRWLLRLEMVGLVFILLAAPLMARGVGLG